MKYRYIIASCSPSDPISNFRLASHREIGKIAKEVGRTFYRVNIPDDLVLSKYSCDNYSTTNDNRTIEELGFDIIMTMWDGSRKVISKDADIKAIEDEQSKKWQKSLYENYDSAYHPYPKTQEDIDFDKQVYREMIKKYEEENPSLAETLKDFYIKRYGESPDCND
jgi:hypothetical protein